MVTEELPELAPVLDPERQPEWLVWHAVVRMPEDDERPLLTVWHAAYTDRDDAEADMLEEMKLWLRLGVRTAGTIAPWVRCPRCALN